jgi:hypothetical protein
LYAAMPPVIPTSTLATQVVYRAGTDEDPAPDTRWRNADRKPVSTLPAAACQLFGVGSPPMLDREWFASINSLSRVPSPRRLLAR